MLSLRYPVIVYLFLMVSIRRVIFSPEQIYHVFNRSVERRPVFTNKREYQHMTNIIRYYRFANLPLRYSQLISLSEEKRKDVMNTLMKSGKTEVIIYAYALMPNHFHFVLKQLTPKGVPIFISNISNSFAKYFNTRHERSGSLWQRPFKAVRIETDEQLFHVTRYIHLNPISAFMIKEETLDAYPWTSLPEYLKEPTERICNTELVKTHFQTIDSYRAFIHNQIEYSQQLEKIKHLSLDYNDE